MATWTSTPATFNAGTGLGASALNANLRDFGLAFGPWSTYTPTVSGWTQGSGTATGAYIQIQKTVLFRARFTFGSGSAVSGPLTMTLPVGCTLPAGGPHYVFNAWATSNTTWYQMFSRADTGGSGTTFSVYYLGTNGAITNPTSTAPFTWATGNIVEVTGVYEAA